MLCESLTEIYSSRLAKQALHSGQYQEGNIMKTIPPFSESVWKSVKDTGDLHPGLTFYRFFEVFGKDEGKHRVSLERMCKQSLPFANKLADRLENQREALEATGIWKMKTFDATLGTRMAMGLGIPSQAENGLCLDHTHGIPLIPGSALKGVAQDYALMEQDALKDSHKRRQVKQDDHSFIAVFGAQTPEGNEPASGDFVSRSGHTVFFDAVPVSNGKKVYPFDMDIINPHYGDYYANEGDKPPADYIRPNPILFLTVKPGTVFRFALAARDVCFALNNEKTGEPGPEIRISAAELLGKAESFLKGALYNLGVGGKTRVGYGIFEGEE
ncbi:MAG: type III-B CRISPR module RAMP protein Cmr6 [Deltaproteobacteria bacterium]|nr:MAG: type III-B CRISPR module RAMP protein Cmr6 [Deltaproteobacteria bacterium]